MKKEQMTQLYYESIGLTPFIRSGEVKLSDDGIIDWDLTSSSGNASESLIFKFPENINWNLLVTKTPLSDDALTKCMYKIDVKQMSTYPQLSLSFIAAHTQTVDWISVSRYNVLLTQDFIDRFSDYIDWGNVNVISKIDMNMVNKYVDKLISSTDTQKIMFQYIYIPENWIEDHWDVLDHTVVCRYGQLSLDFINSHKDTVDPRALFCSGKVDEQWLIDNVDKECWIHSKDVLSHPLSSKMIESFIDDMTVQDLYTLACQQDLSEEIIYKYRDLWYWPMILANQDLSMELINALVDDYFDYDSFLIISKYQKLSERFIHKYRHKLNWKIISANQTHMSERFIWRHRKYIDWDLLLNTGRKFSVKFMNKVNKYLN